MALTVSQKLRIRPGQSLFTIDAPVGFREKLDKLPAGVLVSENATQYDQVHWFVKNRAELEKGMKKLMKLLRPGVTVWVYYPKGRSGVQSDLTRDKGWDSLLAEGDKLTWINLVSFDETWSAFGFRAKTEADTKKEAKGTPEREIFKWVDPATKKVKLPPELNTAFTKNKKAAALFDSLAFSHKKEYIEWIVTAKKEETRKERVKGTLERLVRGWKNPRNI